MAMASEKCIHALPTPSRGCGSMADLRPPQPPHTIAHPLSPRTKISISYRLTHPAVPILPPSPPLSSHTCSARAGGTREAVCSDTPP
jgi:hypothetical protein